MYTSIDIVVTKQMVENLKTRMENTAIEAEALNLVYKQALASFNKNRVSDLFGHMPYDHSPINCIDITDNELIRVVGADNFDNNRARLLYTKKTKAGKFGKTKYCFPLEQALYKLQTIK